MVKDDDIGPQSSWEKGMPWMRNSISEAVTSGTLTPISKLRLSDQETEDFNKGFIFEKTKDVLTKGHVTILAA